MSLLPIFGHDHVLTRLFEALDRDRLAHALLFSGPVGVGKSLVAQHLAARIFCTSPAPGPCGECDGCIQLAAGTHPDFLMITLPPGKKEIGIDLARHLKRFVHQQAVRASRKFVIVDDADRLSLAAQNAMLKTLEEPPPHSLLVLITSTPQSLLATVRSRCQPVRFAPLTPDHVAAVLQQQSDLDEAAARRLAAAADGSPGRALQLRDLLRRDELERLGTLLADLDIDRYVSIVRLAKALAGSEQEMVTRLEWLQSWYGNRAAGAIRGRPVPPEPAAHSDVRGAIDPAEAVQAATAIGEALRTLQRRNPNRPLLAEALALRLAGC